MTLHVAILKRPYVEWILLGRKTVESRLSKTGGPPHGQVASGERIYFKASGGPFLARAVADEVHDFAEQTPREIDRLCEVWNSAVCGPPEYWRQRRDRPYVTLIRLSGVEAVDVGPRFRPQNMRAWYVLADHADPIRDVRLTAGALRNQYVALPRPATADPAESITLEMPDGVEIETRWTAGGNTLRWRGWRRYFEAFAVGEGDAVRFVCLGGRRYRVRFRRRPAE